MLVGALVNKTPNLSLQRMASDSTTSASGEFESPLRVDSRHSLTSATGPPRSTAQYSAVAQPNNRSTVNAPIPTTIVMIMLRVASMTAMAAAADTSLALSSDSASWP